VRKLQSEIARTFAETLSPPPSLFPLKVKSQIQAVRIGRRQIAGKENIMPSKQYEEKQAVEKDLPKESSQDKVTFKVEKDNLKSEKETFGGKDHKEKEKEYKDKEKEKEHTKDKEHKLEGKESALEKVPKSEGHEVYPQIQASAAAPATVVHKALIDKFTNFEKPSKEKPEKTEIKEHKEFFKEIKLEKFEKLEYEHLIGYGSPGGPVEQRLAALEAAVTQLLHFIPENLRPDLSQGALKQEPDATKHSAAGAAKASEAKEPQGKAKS
jgi:hypothetical protein